MAAFLNPPANPHSGTANPPFWNSLGCQRGQAFKNGDKSFRVIPEKARRFRERESASNGRRHRTPNRTRPHGLPKGPVSLRNPTVRAEIARLRHSGADVSMFSYYEPEL